MLIRTATLGVLSGLLAISLGCGGSTTTGPEPSMNPADWPEGGVRIDPETGLKQTGSPVVTISEPLPTSLAY
jgi:hypothetical protein